MVCGQSQEIEKQQSRCHHVGWRRWRHKKKPRIPRRERTEWERATPVGRDTTAQNTKRHNMCWWQKWLTNEMFKITKLNGWLFERWKYTQYLPIIKKSIYQFNTAHQSDFCWLVLQWRENENRVCFYRSNVKLRVKLYTFLDTTACQTLHVRPPLYQPHESCMWHTVPLIIWRHKIPKVNEFHKTNSVSSEVTE